MRYDTPESADRDFDIILSLRRLSLFRCLSPSAGRLWDCMRSVLHMQGSVAELGAAVMQQADVAALWLLEALVLTLPQSLLQAYVVVSTDVGIMSPGQLISKSVISSPFRHDFIV